jgi:glycosyltransferase involved in cell wall biosynthesis
MGAARVPEGYEDKAGSVLFINPLQERHGSTYRARNLSKLLNKKTHLSYVEFKNGVKRGLGPSEGDSYLNLLLAMLRYFSLCLKKEFDLLYLQKPMVLTLPCVALAKLRGKRVVIDFDDLDSLWQTSWLKGQLAGIGERFMPKLADAVTTHNDYLREHIEPLCKKRVFVVPQGVDSGLFNPERFKKTEEKEKLGLKEKTVFCFLGSFTKGSAADLDLIFKAFQAVAAVQDDARLMIVGGGGPLEKDYLSLIRQLGLENRTIITGRKDQKEVPRYLSCADFGLICMRDNLANRCRVSLKLLEYLSMELPVIGHVVGHSRDVFGSYCFLCNPEAESLAGKMLDVIEGQAGKKSARPFIVENYDWEKLLPSLEVVLDYCEVTGP